MHACAVAIIASNLVSVLMSWLYNIVCWELTGFGMYIVGIRLIAVLGAQIH